MHMMLCLGFLVAIFMAVSLLCGSFMIMHKSLIVELCRKGFREQNLGIVDIEAVKFTIATFRSCILLAAYNNKAAVVVTGPVTKYVSQRGKRALLSWPVSASFIFFYWSPCLPAVLLEF